MCFANNPIDAVHMKEMCIKQRDTFAIRCVTFRKKSSFIQFVFIILEPIEFHLNNRK